MPIATETEESRANRAFEAASDAIEGGLTREEFALLALRCIHEAAGMRDKRAHLVAAEAVACLECNDTEGGVVDIEVENLKGEMSR